MPRYIKSDDNTFEFDDDVPDDEAMRAIDDWGLSQPKYSSKQVYGLANKLGKTLRYFTGQIDDTIPSDAIEHIKEIPDLLELIGTGKNKYSDPASEYYKPDYNKTPESATQELMMDIALGGRSVGTGGGPGTAGMFVGKKVIPKSRINAFEESEKQGLGKDILWAQHGMYRGPDGKIRAEISDANSKVIFPTYEPLEQVPMTESLDRVFKHDTLFALYPEIKNIEVQLDINPKHDTHGTFNPKTNTIDVKAKDIEDARSVLLHEIQHKVQEIEDFSKGGNTEMLEHYRKTYSEGIKKERQALSALTEKTTGQSFNQFAYENMQKHRNLSQEELLTKYVATGAIKNPEIAKYFKEYVKDLDIHRKLQTRFEERDVGEESKQAFYRGLYGEIEARNVQKRRDMDSNRRKIFAPYKTEDKPKTKVLHKYRKEKKK